MNAPSTLFPKIAPGKKLCNIIYDGKRYLIYPKYKSCVIYMIKDDLTFAFVQVLKPAGNSVGDQEHPITDVAAHEGIGIIGIIFKNEVICYAPSVVKYSSGDGLSEDLITRTIWMRCACLSLKKNISCICWKPGIHTESPTGREGKVKMVVLVTATDELTFWECTLYDDTTIEVNPSNRSVVDSILQFSKRYSIEVSTTVTGLAYSNDGCFLAEVGLNSSFVKVWYEYDKNVFLDFCTGLHSPGASPEHALSRIKKKTSYGFGYLPHPKCVYDVSWKPATRNGSVRETSTPDISGALLLTNCHDGAARMWMPIHDNGIFKFCLVTFIQSNNAESIKSTNYDINTASGFSLASLINRQKKCEIVYNPVVWMPLCTNVRGYRNTKNTNEQSSKRDVNTHSDHIQKQNNTNLNDLSVSSHRHPPLYDFIDLGKKQLDTGLPILFQVKKDATILFCKLEGSDENNNLYSHNNNLKCGLSCLKNTHTSNHDTKGYMSKMPNMSAGSKSLRPRVIMCALNSPCREFIQFFSNGFVMPYIFVNPEPQIIEYNNIVLLEKALLIGVKNNGYIQAFVMFIKPCEDSMWVIPRIVLLQSFHASCDPITNIWTHSNADIPLHITSSHLYNNPSKPVYTIHTLSVYYGPVSSNTSLISILKIKSPLYNRKNGDKLTDDIKVEWIKTGPSFIVWGLSMLKPLVYTVDISNISPPRNSSPAVHRSYSRVFGSDDSRESLMDYWRTKKRSHHGFESNIYYTLENGVTFMGHIPVEFCENMGDVMKSEGDSSIKKIVMLQLFDSSSHGSIPQATSLNTSLYFKSGMLVVFDNGFYNFWYLTYEKTLGFNKILSRKNYLPDLPPNQTIKMAGHLFSPCEFFQLALTIGYHLFAVVIRSSENKDSLIFFKYGTLDNHRITNCSNSDSGHMSSVGINELHMDIKIVRGDMLEFSCTVSKLPNKLYCLCIWNISEEGMYRRLVHYETFEEDIIDVDWIVLPSSQMILAVAQRHRVMIYCKLNRAIKGGDTIWARLDPFTTTCSEKIFTIKWMPSDCYKLAVITEEIVFLLEDCVNNWNLPTLGNPLLEVQSRMHLSLFSEVDSLGEQPSNYSLPMLYHYMLLGYVLKMLYLVVKHVPQYLEAFQRVCLLWMFQKNMYSNDTTDMNAGNSSDKLWDCDTPDIKNSDQEISVRSSFNKDDMNYIKEYIETNNIEKIGCVNASHLPHFMEVYIESKNLIHSFEMNSLRYIISMLMYKKFNDSSYTCGASVYIWAFFSCSRNNLLEWIKDFYGGKLTWKQAREAGIGWWAGSKATASEIVELIARTEYVGVDGQVRNDPSRCMLFYAVLGRRGALRKIWEIAKHHPESHIMNIFLTLDLSVPSNRTTIQKNAFRLLSKRRFMDAATLFVLIGKIYEASKICAKNLGDAGLALLICRVYDGEDGEIIKKIIQQILLPMAVEKDNRWKVCMLFYIIKEYERSILSIVVPLMQLIKEYSEENDDICCLGNGYLSTMKKPLDNIEHELLLDPLVYTLYRGLIAHRPLLKECSHKCISKYLPGFILQSAARYESIGMYDIAFTLARHIVYESSGLLYISEYTVRGANGGMENTLIAASSIEGTLRGDDYIPKCESDIRRSQLWDILATEFDKNVTTGLPTVSSLAKLALWRLALKFIKEFCISIDTVSTKLVNSFFSILLEDYTKTYISHLSKIIKLIEMPYMLVSRTVILNLDITGVFPILQVFIERSKFLDDISAEAPSQTSIGEFDRALFDEFTSLVFTSCYRQIWLLMNVQGLRLYGNGSNIKTTGRGHINTYMQRLSVLKAGAIARQTLLSIVMCKNICIGVNHNTTSGCAYFEAPNMLENNKIVGNVLFNYATLVKLFFTVFLALLEESMIDRHDILLELVAVISDIFAIVYKIYSLKSSTYDETTGALFSEAEKILTGMFMGRDDKHDRRSESSSDSKIEYESVHEYDFHQNRIPNLQIDEIEDLAQRFLKIIVLCYVISELDRFLGHLMTEMENPLDDDTYWFILELISRPLNRVLCDLQLDYAYVYATQFEMKLESMRKFLKSNKLRVLWDYMAKVEDVSYIYEITRELSSHFNIISCPSSLKSSNLSLLQLEDSSELKITTSLKSVPYITCSRRLVHIHDGNVSCFVVNQANNDIIAVASNGIVDEISVSEISCIMKTASSLSNINPLKRLAKRLEFSKNSLNSKDSTFQSFSDTQKSNSIIDLDNRSLSYSSFGCISGTFRGSYKIGNSYGITNSMHAKTTQGKLPEIPSLDSHPTLGYYIRCFSESDILSVNRDKITLRNHLLRVNTQNTGAGTHTSYVQLAHFGRQKPLVKFTANCSYLTKCRFDNSGARFGAVGLMEKVFVWKFDTYIQSMNPIVEHRVKITSPRDLLFLESSSIVSVGGEGGLNENNIVICDFLLPKSRCVVKEFKTPGDSINCITYYPENKLMIAGGVKGSIYVYDVRKHDPLMVLNSGTENPILSLCVEERTGCLLSGRESGIIDIWDLKNMRLNDTWKMSCASALQNRGPTKRSRLNITKDDHVCSIIEIKAAKKSGDILACSNHGCLWKCRFY